MVIKDDYSGFVRLFYAKGPTAEAASDALMDWFGMFGYVYYWVSDQGSHFKNQVLKDMSRIIGANHHFTLA